MLKQVAHFLVNYWVQMAVLITSLTSLLAILLSYIPKLKEFRYTKVRENRVTEVKEFLKCYQVMYLAIFDYYYFAKGYPSYERKEVEEAVQKANAELFLQALIIKLFLKPQEQKIVDDVRVQLSIARDNVFSVVIDKDFKAFSEESKKNLSNTTEILYNKIPPLIEKLASDFRKDFGIK